MSTVLERVKKLKMPISPEARSCYVKIQKVIPDFIEHIDLANTWIQDAKIRNMNRIVAKAHSGILKGCLWFCDPVTHKVLLDKKDWLFAATNHEIWLPLALTFPQLRPMILTGSLSRTVAIYLNDMTEYFCMEQFFKENNDDISKHRCLTLNDSYWLVFSDQVQEKHVYLKTGQREINNMLPITFLCASDLIPIINTVEWAPTPQIVKGANPSFPSNFTNIPEFLKKFFVKPI